MSDGSDQRSCNFVPGRNTDLAEIPFSEHSRATVVLYRVAIFHNESPRRTVYVVALELEPPPPRAMFLAWLDERTPGTILSRCPIDSVECNRIPLAEAMALELVP